MSATSLLVLYHLDENEMTVDTLREQEGIDVDRTTLHRSLLRHVAEGTLTRRVREQSGLPGRPAHVYRLTDRGRERYSKRLQVAGRMMTEEKSA